MKYCVICGYKMRNGDETDVCPACRQGVKKTDWRAELDRVRRVLEAEKSKTIQSAEYIAVCESRIRSFMTEHEGE